MADGLMSSSPPADTAALDRRADLADRLPALRRRVAAACQAAGRAASDVTIVAVTKTFPASDVALLAWLGVDDCGETRDQEAAPKAAEVAALVPGGVRWHFVGQLQVNKVASVIKYADVVHSVDRMRLVRALGSRAAAAGRQITCLVQVDLDEGVAAAGGQAGRGGALPGEVPAVADLVAAQGGPVIGGGKGRGPPPRAAPPRLAKPLEV